MTIAAIASLPAIAPGIAVPVSPGELIDKITILEIKAERIGDAAKRHNVVIELTALRTVRDSVLPASAALDDLTQRLHSVNELLWVIEDEIRSCERLGDFGSVFIELARSVYRTNDQRAAIKQRINILLGSELIEEKSYAAY